MAISLDPVRQPLAPIRAWIVKGTKTREDGTVAAFSGTAWGRTEAEARESHDRLIAADRRIRAANGADDDDLVGYTLEFIAVNPSY